MKAPSEYFKKAFAPQSDSKTAKAFVFIRNHVRFSVLTSRLLRVEVDRDGIFTDGPTQAVICRRFDEPEHKITVNGSTVTVATKDTVFRYDTAKKKMLSVTLRSMGEVTDYKTGNLKGTYRTLDMVNGGTKLDDGLISRGGVAVLDDSKTVLIAPDGTIKERKKCRDEYYFAYGHDYRACIRDFYRLSGNSPLVPRYCLGNWWSRYKAYTQQEYIDLMENFIDGEIPVTVATIDMDWHWVDVIDRFGKKDAMYQREGKPVQNLFEVFQSQGWTGYSWNTELFPDYKKFLRYLHDNNFKVTMNLHPAQGVRPFEDMYPEMARQMGIDPETREHIHFDITDPQFVDAYFNVLHKPYENDGVDFWWIDWQQEKTTKVKGLDPLWALNHYHYLAAKRDNRRPLILSRFAKIGSHRYPLGFSGDTVISWASLDFQPYFTATAANVGYTWWSHDIGGHHMGIHNDELYIRWVQLGLYSPINRLHSTSDEFMGKEPWKYSSTANAAAVSALRERHALIPYLYSMNYRNHKDGIALCEPMYYTYPENQEAYDAKNEYFFGSELLVCPVTSPSSRKTNLSAVKVWLPDGKWTDIYTGAVYSGGQTVTMYRDLNSIPVLARAGAIIPMSDNDRTNDWSNPEKMTVRIYKGTNSFTLYEDDGESLDFEQGKSVTTVYKVREAGRDLMFKICPAEGELSLIPEKRSYTLVFEDIKTCESLSVKANGRELSYTERERHGKVYVTVENVPVNGELEIELMSVTEKKNADKKEAVINMISRFQGENMAKRIQFAPFLKDLTKPFPSNDPDLKGPIDEIFAMKY